MNNTPQTNREADRLKALREHALLDTLPEPLFDEIVRRAASLCDAPIALLALVDERRQWYKARIGFALPELPRSVGFDSWTIGQQEPLIVPNAQEDPRFQNDPLVTSELNIRFYAGIPLLTEEGLAIGALSTMDYTARELTPAQLKGLLDQAKQAMMQFDLRRKMMESIHRQRSPEPVKIVPVNAPSESEADPVLPDLMMRFGPDLRYIYVSPFSIESIGVRPDTLLGRTVGNERTPLPFADPLRPALERAVTSGRIEEIQFVYPSPSGERTFQTRLMPEISAGSVTGVLSITRDITREHKTFGSPAPAPVKSSLRALLGVAVAESSSVSAMLRACAQAIADFSGVNIVRVWTRDTHRNVLVLRAQAGIAVTESEILVTEVPLPGEIETAEEAAEQVYRAEQPDAEVAGLAQRDAFALSAGNLLIGLVDIRGAGPLVAEMRAEILEALGAMAMALRRGQDADLLAQQAAVLANELMDARMSLQREAENAANMAHEIRTPLNSVIGLTNLMLGTQLNQTQRELSEMTRSSARALLSLVDDTFDLSRPGGVEIVLEPASFELRSLVEEIVSSLAPKAQGNGLDLILRFAPTMPPRLIGDPQRIRQILTNLTENAIKFTRRGYVLVDTSHGEPIEGRLDIEISVEDTGIGIAPEQQEAIFDKFVQAGSLPDSRDRGVGLGLAISRDFAMRMGGNIDVRSRLGEGSIFRLTLQLPIDAAHLPASSPDPSLQGIRVLIVHGPELQQFALRELLEFWGMRVGLCNSTGEMLEAMHSEIANRDPYRVVIIDERLTGNDSGPIIEAILNTEGFQFAHLVVLTSVGRNIAVERMVSEGLAWSVSKPVRQTPMWETLLSLVKDLKDVPLPAMPRPAPALESPDAERDPFPIEYEAPATTGELEAEDAHRDLEVGEGTQAEPEADSQNSAVPADQSSPDQSEGATPDHDGLHEAASEATQPETETMETAPLDAVAPPAEAGVVETSAPEKAADEPAVESHEAQDVESTGDEPIGGGSSATMPEEPAEAETHGAEEPADVTPLLEDDNPTFGPQEAQSQDTPELLVTAASAGEYEEEPDSMSAPAAAEEDQIQAGKLYVLVVEDDMVNQRVTEMMLTKIGCIVDVASNGTEALELFETRVYSLVLIDCKMNGIDGYQTTAAIRRMEAGERHTPIIAVTADTAPGVRERCLQAGMDAYIAKPIHEEQLQYEIETRLKRSLGPVAAPSALPIDEILDRNGLMERVGNDTEVLRSLARLADTECSRLIGEIREAVAAGDRYEFLRGTHKMRGMVMSINARAAVEVVHRLELTANEGRPADAEALLGILEQELERLQAAMQIIIQQREP